MDETKTMIEQINYLDKIYGKDYTDKWISEKIREALKDRLVNCLISNALDEEKINLKRQGRVGHIYLITHIPSGKRYVGQTRRTIEERYKAHFSQAKTENRDKKISTPLHEDMCKYGQEAFKIELLEECPIERLTERENYYIDFLKTSIQYPLGYNIAECGIQINYRRFQGSFNKNEMKEQIKKYSRSFNGTYTDKEVKRITGISHATYYKYKKEIKEELGE